ncbi:MAG: Kdo hydroxylase family protein [Burkholderiaceae bacterium]
MENQIIEIGSSDWNLGATDQAWIRGLEAGKVLYFPNLTFKLNSGEASILKPELQAPGTRSITLDIEDRFKGANGSEAEKENIRQMIGRFRAQAKQLIHSLLPSYEKAVRYATTSFRPLQVETRTQSWRADDKRLHVDAFAGRPNHGERILRVFTNINPANVPRVWRVGEPFETVAKRFLPQMDAYSRLDAYKLRLLFKTKPIRSEYDHMMLQLHDRMKLDLDYQQSASQVTMPFPSGSTWVCFSDQTSHAVMSGQYMMEQTLHLPVVSQYDPESSPLSILSRLTGRRLV